MQVKGRSKLAIQPIPQHDIAIHLTHAEERGEDLPVAITVSNEPIILLVGAMPILYDQWEYKTAAAMQGQPYKVVKTSKGLDVPWGSEYMLEGRILSCQREPAGPFGEFPGYYSGGHKFPVIEIDRVSHRKDQSRRGCISASRGPELDYCQALTTCAPIYVQLKTTFPEVFAVNALYTHGFVVIVSTDAGTGGVRQISGHACTQYAARPRLREGRHCRR
jgi:vanillate/4-hydroxybenzoate decarboxylase subunit C